MNKIFLKIVKVVLIFLIILIFISIVILIYFIISNKYKTVYYAEDFGIEVIKSLNDENNNGVDDYTDILLGAKQDAENKPKYVSKYYAGGYPPDNEGVCADVIWRALKNAGYDLKTLVDEDIKNNLDEYPRVNGMPDSNIDFRRVPNLKVYFERTAVKLTNDITQISEFQPGDIVIFGRNDHIGIISDKRNKDGIPYLIHNASQPNREEDVLWLLDKFMGITGHYRWNIN